MKRGSTIAWSLAMAALGVLSSGPAWAGSPIQIPEPASLALLAVGVGAIAIFRARRGR